MAEQQFEYDTTSFSTTPALIAPGEALWLDALTEHNKFVTTLFSNATGNTIAIFSDIKTLWQSELVKVLPWVERKK